MRFTRKTGHYLLLLLGSGLLVAYFARVDTGQLVARVSAFPLSLGLLIFGLNLVPGLLKWTRWDYFLRSTRIPTRGIRDYLSVNASFFWGLVTPGTAGEVTRAISLGEDAGRGVSLIAFEKIADLWALVVLTIAAGLVGADSRAVVPVCVLLLPASLTTFHLLVSRSGRFIAVAVRWAQRMSGRDRFQGIRAVVLELDELAENRPLRRNSLLFSLSIWIVAFIQMHLIFTGLGVDLPATRTGISFFAPYLGGLLSMVPLGVGTFDLGVNAISNLYDPSDATRMALAPVVYRAIVTAPVVLFGYLCQVLLTVKSHDWLLTDKPWKN